MSLTHTAILNYCAALQADHYHVRLVNFATEAAIPVNYSAEQLARLETVNYLRGRNAEGFNIYARPVGWQYVLLDDLTRDVLPDVAPLRPCLLLETSPANYQAWLILPDVPHHRDGAKAICRELAGRFGADLASADPDHVGRLPGFTNRKAKYQMTNGLFPFVKLHRSEHRLSTFYPGGGAVQYNESSSTIAVGQPTVKPTKRSSSEQDFGQACWLIRQGQSDEQIYEHLLAASPNLRDRKGRHLESYLHRTINNARRCTS